MASSTAGRGEVLRGDQLDGRVLALDLAVDDGEQLGVAVGGPGHQAVSLGRWVPEARAVIPATSESRWASRAAASAASASMLGELVDPALVAAAFERGREQDLDDLVGQAGADDARRPSTGRWRRCAGGPCGRCRGRCTARRGRRGPCWRRAARPGRCRRGRCRGRRRPGRRPGRPRRRRPGSRPTPRESVPRSTTSWPASARTLDEVGLQVVAGVVGADGDPHVRSSPRTCPGAEERGRPGVDQEVDETAGQVVELGGARQVRAPRATVAGRRRRRPRRFRRGRRLRGRCRARPASGRTGRVHGPTASPRRTSSLRVNVRVNAIGQDHRGLADVRSGPCR